MSTRFLVADGICGPLYACIAEARFVTPEVSISKLAATLRPYPDEDCAISALLAAGGANVRAVRT